MALETCFQVTTTAPTTSTINRACALHTLPHKEKLHFPPWKVLGRTVSSIPSSSSSTTSPSSPLLAASPPNRRRVSSIVCKAKSTIDKVLVVSDSEWNNAVIGCENPVLVEFWAPWCGPCRMIAPIIDELAKEYAGKITCYKLNTDDCPSIPTQYGIRSIPTVLLFKNGEKKETIVGAVPKSTLTNTIDKYLEMGSP